MGLMKEHGLALLARKHFLASDVSILPTVTGNYADFTNDQAHYIGDHMKSAMTRYAHEYYIQLVLCTMSSTL